MLQSLHLWEACQGEACHARDVSFKTSHGVPEYLLEKHNQSKVRSDNGKNGHCPGWKGQGYLDCTPKIVKNQEEASQGSLLTSQAFCHLIISTVGSWAPIPSPQKSFESILNTISYSSCFCILCRNIKIFLQQQKMSQSFLYKFQPLPSSRSEVQYTLPRALSQCSPLTHESPCMQG